MDTLMTVSPRKPLATEHVDALKAARARRDEAESARADAMSNLEEVIALARIEGGASWSVIVEHTGVSDKSAQKWVRLYKERHGL